MLAPARLRRPPQRRHLVALASAAIVFGVAIRVVVYRSAIGHLGTDEATWGLMARHAADGELSAFFWGQSYGGTQEVLPVALLFALFGTHLVLMRLVPILLTVLASAVLWRIARHSLGDLPALVAVLLLWIWPIYAVWKVEVWSGFYGAGLLYVTLVLLLTLALAREPTPLRVAVTGLVLGLAFWESVQTVAIVLPCLAWLTLRQPRVWLRSWLALPGFVIGALPWLLSNLRHDWWSFTLLGSGGTYESRLRGYFGATLPAMLGLRVPFSLDWLAGRAPSLLLYGGLGLAFLVAAWRWRRSELSLLLFVIGTYPFLYATSRLTAITAEPRYVLVLVPVLVLVAAAWATTLPRAVSLLGVAAVVSALGLARWIEWRESLAREDAFNPGEVDVRPAIAALDAAGVDRAYADYSIAYRVTFETRERIVVSEADLANVAVVAPGRVLPPQPTSYRMHHHPAYDEAVRRAPRFAYVFVRRESGQARAERLLVAQGYRKREVGTLMLFVSPRQRG
jgi:hypothetical protein